ncbi:MAG: hypothetical protein U9N73_09990, partial [Candidatus Auribacterota bacterium]|nr:hypothetical protein [Candidatus Auribacterota bacterium]
MNDIDNDAMIEMHEPKMHGHEEAENREEEYDISPEREAPIWSFDCMMICTCLGLGLSNKDIKKLCHKYELIPKDQAVDPGYGFFRLHHASHKKSLLTKKLTKMFNQRYHLTIEKVRRMPEEAEQEWNNLIKEAMEGHPMPVLWALLTD